jgi:hypothetical protein
MVCLNPAEILLSMGNFFYSFFLREVYHKNFTGAMPIAAQKMVKGSNFFVGHKDSKNGNHQSR